MTDFLYYSKVLNTINRKNEHLIILIFFDFKTLKNFDKP